MDEVATATKAVPQAVEAMQKSECLCILDNDLEYVTGKQVAHHCETSAQHNTHLSRKGQGA